MASNKKISELTEFTAAQLADDDLIVMVDVSDSTTKKVAASTFRATVSGVESLTAVAPLSVDAPDGDVTIQITDPLPIANGGTAATTASVARTNLGLGSIATQNSNSVSITGGAISGITDLAVADGGTGASNAAAARTNLGAAASGVNSDITSLTGLTTPLSVSQGGTGSTTLTSNNVILGNGSSAVQLVAPGTSGNILTSNGTTWSSSAPASSGVTSFSAGSTGFTPATATTGAVTLAGTLDADNGGTGISSYAVGDVLYANTTSTLAKLADVATGSALISGGVGTAPSYGKIGLTTHISGTLAIGNGGTGATTAATAATALGVGTGDSPTFAGLNIDTNLGVDGQWNTSGLTVYANGVTPQHDGILHVMSGSAGTVTPPAGADELVVEGSGNTGIAILAPDANTSAINFGSPTDSRGASLEWNQSGLVFNVGTDITNGVTRLRAGDATSMAELTTTGLTVHSSGVTPQHDGVLHVMSGSAGTISARSDADDLIIEAATDAGMSILTGDNALARIRMTNPTDGNSGGALLAWDDSVSQFSMQTTTAGSVLRFYTGAQQLSGEWNTTGLTCFASGVTPQHDGVLHVMSGTAGTVSARSDADEFTVEGAADSGISILTPDGFGGTLRFSSPTSQLLGKVGCSYNSGNPSFALGTQYGGGTVTILSGAGTTALTLNSSQQMVALPTYSVTVGATNRDLYIDNTGLIGYVSSLRAAKTEIYPITDTSWLHALTPVSFKYRKKAEDGSYTNEIDGDIQYGMIAEDVAAVRPDLCFYDDVADLNENGEKTETTHKELRGIQYSKLVPVLLKEVQKLRAELNQMKVN